MEQEQGEQQDVDNLALLMSPDELKKMGTTYFQRYMRDKKSLKGWEFVTRRSATGLKRR